MELTKNKLKTIIIGRLIIAICFIHLITWQRQYPYYIVYRELYFIPLIMAAFWFGLQGALITSLLITAFYFSFTMVELRGFIPEKFDTIMEIMLLNEALAKVLVLSS